MDELTQLVDKNFYVITHLFEYGALKSEPSPSDPTKARVLSDEFNTIAELKDYLSKIYLSEEVDRLLNRYFDNRPLYFEENGILMAWVDQIPGAGYFGIIDLYQISIQTQTDDEIVFTVDIPVFTDEGEEPEIKHYTVFARRENGWKITRMFG